MRSLKTSNWRIALIIAGLLHIVFFFVLPYISVSDEVMQLEGIESEYQNFTGFTFISSGSTSGYPEITFLLILPMILGIIISLICFFTRKAGYITTIIASAAQAAIYGLWCYGFSTYIADGYEFVFNSYTAIIFFLFVALQILIAIIGLCKKDWKQAVETGPGQDTDSSSNPDVKPKHIMNGTIRGLSGDYFNAVLPVLSGKNIVIGRDPTISHIIVKNGKVSRRHCEITYDSENEMYIVTDCSTNGTFYASGQRLPLNKPVHMYPGSTIRIGEDGDEFRLG